MTERLSSGVWKNLEVRAGSEQELEYIDVGYTAVPPTGWCTNYSRSDLPDHIRDQWAGMDSPAIPRMPKGSLHFYDLDYEVAEKILREGNWRKVA
jgi:hypothetical protein